MATRIISGIVGAVIALLVLFLHNTIAFPIAAGIVAAILMFEFLRVNNLFRYRISALRCGGIPSLVGGDMNSLY